MNPVTDKLLKEKLRQGAATLKNGIYANAGGGALAITFAVTKEPVAFADKDTLAFAPIAVGERWSTELWDCAWFRITGRAECRDTVYLALDVEGEGCVYDTNGVPVRGITNVSSDFDRSLGFPGKRYVPVTECMPNGGTELDIWVDAANNDLFGSVHAGIVKECDLVVCDVERRNLFYDYTFLHNLAESVPETDPLHYTLCYALEQVAVRAASEMSAQTVAACREILRPHLQRKNIPDPLLAFYAVGHSHMDLAWKWPLRETRRKAIRTFSTAIANMKNYPDYIYGASQPQQFAWVKEDCPVLFEKLRQAVKEGRLELQGGMWVEADTNLPSGEALVRQFLYGKKFWREEFGADTDTLWLPDVFGFSGALPQIMRGCGCENFLTIKLSWNMVNEFPHHSFRWQGIDGSEVLVHMPPEGTYNSSATPKALRYAAGNYAERGRSRNAMMLYGIGDGGGGPGREHLEYVAREKDICGVPNVQCAPSSAFFAALRAEQDKLPVYKGEIYLERHQGTYTSQSDNKYYNRKAENGLAAYEFAQVAAHKREKESTDALWKEVLLYQFHDILPGSCIARVYTESVARYKEIDAALSTRTANLFASLGKTPCVYNATSFTRDEYVPYNGAWYRVHALPYSVTALGTPETEFTVYANANTVGNALTQVTLADDGQIKSISDKRNGREALRAESGAFDVYTDVGNAWDFYPDYRLGGAERFVLQQKEPFTDGARAGVRLTYAYNRSRLVQTVSLTENDPAVRIDVTVDWRESEKMLRTDFYPAVSADTATCDIQFGSVSRSAANNNAVEIAQYEVCAHKWVDMSQLDYGVAVLNNGKYGYRLKDGCISMHLLRSQSDPCKEQDKGVHTFTYAVYPHENGVYASDVAAKGYALNRPLVCVLSAERAPVAQTDNAHVVIETVKPAEDGNGTVVRLYNDTPQPVTATLSAHGKLVRTDMLENNGEETDGRLRLNGFEIATIRIV